MSRIFTAHPSESRGRRASGLCAVHPPVPFGSSAGWQGGASGRLLILDVCCLVTWLQSRADACQMPTQFSDHFSPKEKLLATRIRFVLFASLALMLGNCFAYTSVAAIDGYVLSAWWRASNYESQKEADLAAFEGCRSEARKNGIGNLAKKCKVVTRAKGPGYGSIVCGEGGCNWAIGYASGQAAVDAAYEGCNKSYKNCREQNIDFWEDFSGFPAKNPEKLTGGDCRPRTTTLRCQSSCSNGDCVVSYENGCKIRVQVNPRFDGFQNQWVYPSPPC
ncbi:hypothetical protein [Paucibacter sp. KCTC 42545]|uniref:hypothetical protein n=1 Tax=Paucibacter sp. KCTC 42545 TaxID=1768242 RepID=UPI0012E33179|nr:hypothetical protein [Paucibacter sp. KCTC 42545]